MVKARNTPLLSWSTILILVQTFNCMRNFTLLTLAMCFIALTSNAQINKGTVLLGGNLGASTNTTSATNNNSESSQKGFYVSPSIGFVTKDNTVWGLQLSYSHGKSDNNTNADVYTNDGYGGSVFYRRYLTLGKNFYLFGQADAGYNYSKGKQVYATGSSRTSRTDGVYLNAYPGITYVVRKNFHLEASINNLVSLGYSYATITDVNNGSASSYKQKGFALSSNASSNNPLSIGFRFAL